MLWDARGVGSEWVPPLSGRAAPKSSRPRTAARDKGPNGMWEKPTAAVRRVKSDFGWFPHRDARSLALSKEANVRPRESSGNGAKNDDRLQRESDLARVRYRGAEALVDGGYFRVKACQIVRAKRLSTRIRFMVRTITTGNRTMRKAITAQLETGNDPNHMTNTVITAPTMAIRLTIQMDRTDCRRGLSTDTITR